MKKIIIIVISTIIIAIVLTSSVIRLRKFLLSRIDAKVAAEITVLRTQSGAQRPTVPPSALPQTPDQNSLEASGNGDLSARIATLEKLALSGNQNVTNRLPLISDYRGSGAAVFAMIDAVGPYRKNGLYEVYGGSFRERRSGPVRVMEAQFEISHDEGWLIWSPDDSPARDATHLSIEFAESPKAGKITVGFVLDDGQVVSYSLDTGAATPGPAGLLASLLPKDMTELANAKQPIALPKPSGNKMIVALPPHMLLKLRNGQRNQISHWFFKVNGAAGTSVHLRQMALIRPAQPATSAGVTLSGRVAGADYPPGTQIELLNEAGGISQQSLATDGAFAFTGVDPEQVVSLRVRHPRILHYATLGRWFVPSYSRNDILVDLAPRYINSDGHAPDPSKARFVGPRVPSPASALYEPHARQYWPGGSVIQEYDSTTFTNNHGYLDRDRFFDNPDKCVRLASTGGSDMVALQVRPHEKFNIILEETLGVALGKCVEVISAGADNGDLGTNYPRIRDYTSKFNVAHTLVSMASGLVYQVNPQMLRDGLGMDPENSALPNFYYDKNGVFSFRGASAVFPVFMTKPTHPEYAKGIPFSYTLSVPFEVMPDAGKEAFRYWTEIVNYIERKHPGQNFVFHTGVDQAQCRKNCEATLTLEDGRKVLSGSRGYVNTLNQYCTQNSYKCINPSFSEFYKEKPSLLTFEYDNHYSLLGHQWLAEQLTAPMVKLLGESPR
ncbi:MAG: hypothetical protein ACKVON_11695 [Beijerinckiaceae bacterium]